MKMKKTLLAQFCLLAISLMAFPGPDQRVFSLQSAVETALSQNPLGLASQFQVDKAGLEVRKARLQRFIPQLKFQMNTGFVPEARGDIFFSPDKSDDLNGFGPFYRLNLELIQPVFTFGRTSAALQASQHGLSLERSKQKHVLEKIAVEVIRAYWGLSTALKAESVARDLRKNYDKLLAEVEERLEDEDSEVDDSDLLEVKTFHFSVEENFIKSAERKTLATRLFNSLLSIELETNIGTSGETSPEFVTDESTLEKCIIAAQTFRPEVTGLVSAVGALKAKLDLEKRNRYPLVFLFAGLGYAKADNRTDQTNPFILDNFNYRRVTAALGISWDLNFWEHKLEAKKAEADFRAAREKLDALKTQVAVEVNQIFLEVQKNKALLDEARKSLKSAKTWLRVSMENWDMGIGDVRRMIRAYEAYYRMLGVEIEYEYRFNTSLAELAHTVGNTKIYLDWVKNGKVIFHSN